MKHSAIFAASLACLCLSAQAQSNVTVYGRLNTTFESQQDGNAGRVTTLNNNSSRFGFRGTEDMGGGLKAGFVLESGFSSTTGAQSSTALFARQASLQVTSDTAGGLRLGNWFPGSYFATADYVSNHNHDTGRSSDALYSFAAFPRNNKVGYFTPTIGGFNGELAYAFKDGTNAKAIDLSGNYVSGPLHAGAGYTKQDKVQQTAVRGLYIAGPVTVGGYFQRESADGSVFGTSRNIYRLSGMYTMGLSEFHLNFGGTDKGGTQAEKATQSTLAYNYNLSKRTKLYTYYTKVSSATSANSSNSVAFGVRHNF
jgi:predicted porin